MNDRRKRRDRRPINISSKSFQCAPLLPAAVITNQHTCIASDLICDTELVEPWWFRLPLYLSPQLPSIHRKVRSIPHRKRSGLPHKHHLKSRLFQIRRSPDHRVSAYLAGARSSVPITKTFSYKSASNEPVICSPRIWIFELGSQSEQGVGGMGRPAHGRPRGSERYFRRPVSYSKVRQVA